MPRPLRVLTFLHSFEPGGVERVALRLHTAWAAMGVDARLVLGRDDGVQRPDWPDLAYRSLALTLLKTARFETLWLITQLPRQIRQQRPDVLFCAGNTYAVVAVAMKLLLGSECPPIVAKVSNDLARRDLGALHRWLYRRWLRIQGRFIDRFVGMAAPMAAEIAGAMGVDRGHVAIVNDPALNGRDLMAEPRRTVRQPGEGTRYIAVGRLVAQKNFGILLEAFAACARPRDRLVIAGDGAEKSALVQRARELGIGRRVEFPGHVAAIGDRLQASDVLVLSSDYEGVPAVVLEALAAGLAIVATDCSTSMPYLLEDGALGTLVPVGDSAALARAMGTAAGCRPDYARAQAQARRYTVETAASAYLAVFSAVALPATASATLRQSPRCEFQVSAAS